MNAATAAITPLRDPTGRLLSECGGLWDCRDGGQTWGDSVDGGEDAVVAGMGGGSAAWASGHDRRDGPHVVAVVFCEVGEAIWVPIDGKPTGVVSNEVPCSRSHSATGTRTTPPSRTITQDDESETLMAASSVSEA